MDITNPHIDQDKKTRAEKTKLRAASLHDKADAATKRGMALMDALPYGQPILVDHYSAPKHRRLLAQQHRAFDSACKLQSTAKILEQRRPTTGIDTTDPRAIEKLTQKLETALADHDNMKSANKILKNRKISDAEGGSILREKFGYNDETIAGLYNANCRVASGAPAGFSLVNSLARIKGIRDRIASINRLQQQAGINENTDTYRINTADGRILVTFHDGAPAQIVRNAMRKHGFLWSPTRSAWVRKITANALSATRRLVTVLSDIASTHP